MYQLTRFFLDLALLKRRPQDLPGSLFLLNALLLVNLLVNLWLAISVFPEPVDALMANLTELIVTAGLLYAGLHLSGKSGRWVQSFSALLGLGILAGLVSILYRLAVTAFGLTLVVRLLDLLLFVWVLLAMAHVIRHAFDMPFAFAVLVVFVFCMFELGLIARWFGPGLAAAS